MGAPVYLALLHYPVRDREGSTVASAVTTLDVHDIARTARTYGAKGYYVVTPIDAQHVLIRRILEHWRSGAGLRRMPERAQALSLCSPCHSLEDAVAAVEEDTGMRPRLVATAARESAREITQFGALRSVVNGSMTPLLLLFGTGHGLADALLEAADYLLEPIHGAGDYNHLAVRSAVAITLDRLLGR